MNIQHIQKLFVINRIKILYLTQKEKYLKQKIKCFSNHNPLQRALRLKYQVIYHKYLRMYLNVKRLCYK